MAIISINTETSVPFRRTILYKALVDPVSFDAPAAPEVLTVDKWLAPLALPTRRGGLSINNQTPLFFVEAAPFTEAVSIDRWLQPLAEPRRFPRYTPVYEQPYIAFVKADPFPETITAVWAQPLSVPTRRIRFAEHPAFFTPGYYFPPNPDIPVDRWFSPMALPTRRRVPVSEYPYLSFVKASPFGETIRLQWWSQLSRPVLRTSRRALLMEGCAVVFVPTILGSSRGYFIT